LHEVAEYIVAAALIAVGFHVFGAAQLLLVAVGAVMLVVGAFSDGKLGAFHVLGRRAHHVADLVLIVVLVLSPALLYHDLHVPGTVLAVVVALVLLRIERGTLYHDVARPVRGTPAVAVPAGAASAQGPDQAQGPASGQGPASRQSQGPASGQAQGPASAQAADPMARLGATAGAVASSAALTASQLAPVAGRAAKVGVRSLGIVAGATRRAARAHAERRSTDGS
jgi:hypothetical protein